MTRSKSGVPPRSGPPPKPQGPPNPWVSIWFRPRRTIRYLVDHRPGYGVAFLAGMIGILQFMMHLLRAADTGRIEMDSRVIAIAVLGGFLVGLLALYLLSALYRLTGQWFGGNAEGEDVQAAIAWSGMPIFFVLVIWFILFYKENLGLYELPFPPALYPLLVSFFSFWSLLLVCYTLAEVHRFSVWKSFFTILSGSLVLIVLIVALATIFFVMNLPTLTRLVEQRGGQERLATLRLVSQKISSLHQNIIPKAQEILSQAVEIPEVNESDLDLLRLSREVVQIKLKRGDVLESPLLDYDKEYLYVETPQGILNLPRRIVERIDWKGRPSEPPSVSEESPPSAVPPAS